jgi:transcriptional regulator with XRE-family HTH domain
MTLTEQIIASGKTRTAICQEAGISRQTLWNIENEVKGKTPRPETLASIFAAIGVDSTAEAQ